MLAAAPAPGWRRKIPRVAASDLCRGNPTKNLRGCWGSCYHMYKLQVSVYCRSVRAVVFQSSQAVVFCQPPSSCHVLARSSLLHALSLARKALILPLLGQEPRGLHLWLNLERKRNLLGLGPYRPLNPNPQSQSCFASESVSQQLVQRHARCPIYTILDQDTFFDHT